MTPFHAHLLRLEIENAREKWTATPHGTFEKLYTAEALRKPLFAPGWARVWVCKSPTNQVIAHASLVDIGEVDIVGGHISVEWPYRKLRLARALQDKRLSFCDHHGLTLTGTIAIGNDTSWFGCRRMGFEFTRFDSETREIWVHRPPYSMGTRSP